MKFMLLKHLYKHIYICINLHNIPLFQVYICGCDAKAVTPFLTSIICESPVHPMWKCESVTMPTTAVVPLRKFYTQ